MPQRRKQRTSDQSLALLIRQIEAKDFSVVFLARMEPLQSGPAFRCRTTTSSITSTSCHCLRRHNKQSIRQDRRTHQITSVTVVFETFLRQPATTSPQLALRLQRLSTIRKCLIH